MEDEGCASEDGMVWGCYLHGLFWNENLLRAISNHLGLRFRKPESWIDRFSDIVERSIDIDFIFRSALE